jgi:hypothetical protein
MRNNATKPLDGACAGRVLSEQNMRSHLIIMGGVFRKDSSKVQPPALSGVAGTKDQGARSSGAATCGLCSSAAATHGSTDGDGGTARVHLGAAVDGGFSSAISFDAVKMLLLARLENRPARLDLTFYPYLPAATVGTTDPRAYLGLIANSASTAGAAGAWA